MDSGITWLELTALGLAIVGCFSVPTLLGLWLAKTRLHWVLQALLIFAIASPLMLIRAFDLMLIVLVNALSVLIGLKLWQQWQQRRSETSDDSTRKPWFQLGIQDGLAVFVLLAIVAAMWAHASKANAWTDDPGTVFIGVLQCSFIGAAAAIWGTSLLLFRVVRFRFWLPMLALLAASPIAAGWGLFTAEKFRYATFLFTFEFPFFSLPPKTTLTESAVGWSIVFAVQALTVACIVWLFLGRVTRDSDSKLNGFSMTSWSWLVLGKNVFGASLLVLLLSSFGYFFCLLLPSPTYSPIRKVITGEPNRYPDLIAAVETLSTATGIFHPPVKPGPALAGMIASQAKTYDDIELILQADNCFCIDWDSVQFDFNGDSSRSSEFRTIARVLSKRALQSLHESRHDDVVSDGLLCLELASRISIDGIFVQSMVGTACEGIGIKAAIPGIDRASIEKLKIAASQLDEMVAEHGPLNAEMERLKIADEYFTTNTKSTHWLDRLAVCFLDKSSMQDSIRDMLVRRNVLRDLLRTEIAIRLYRFEFGQFPNHLEALVPDFLSQSPNDWYAEAKQQPFYYKVSGSGVSYQLYSVGGDGDDDGGECLENYWDEGDLDLIALFGDRLANNAKEVAEYEAEQAGIASEQREWEELDALDDENWEDPEPPTREDLKESQE